MRTAVIVVDMLADTLDQNEYPITPCARAIVPGINALCAWAREQGHPVVFACDSFLPGDFIFTGRMKPHSLRGTPESEPSRLLDRKPGDAVLPKRRFSAFYKTDLDQSLRSWGVSEVAVCGIATQICVLSTALDAVANDFRATMIEDCTASFKPEQHRATLDLYRKGPLHPLLQVLSADRYMDAGA
ncbi:MAG: cysteine hydrolase [Deltaproteobacteria bacterium]|nr:cysteine hydrolase [Deltaproteobacteria bacterium]